MPPKNVLVLGKIPPPYMGTSIFMEVLLNSHIKKYFSIIPFDTNVHKSLQSLGKFNFKKVFINFGKYVGLALTIIKEKPHLAHIPISQATIGFLKDSLYIIICRLFGIRIVVQLHGSNILNWIEGAANATRIYVKQILRLADGVIVLGENLKYLFEPFFEKEQIFVVPNGANYTIPGIRQSNRNTILYLSNLQPSKGISDLMEAMLILHRDLGLQFNCNIVGAWFDKDTKTRCHDIVNENNLPVSFHEPVFGDEKFDYYVNSDIFVFAPREPEGHPWVIVEAMAAGLPIISTDQGAICQSVIDGKNGFLVEKRNPSQMAEKIKILIEDTELRKRMGVNSRQLYLQNFTEEKMVERLTYTYNKMLNSN